MGPTPNNPALTEQSEQPADKILASKMSGCNLSSETRLAPAETEQLYNHLNIFIGHVDDGVNVDHIRYITLQLKDLKDQLVVKLSALADKFRAIGWKGRVVKIEKEIMRIMDRVYRALKKLSRREVEDDLKMISTSENAEDDASNITDGEGEDCPASDAGSEVQEPLSNTWAEINTAASLLAASYVNSILPSDAPVSPSPYQEVPQSHPESSPPNPSVIYRKSTECPPSHQNPPVESDLPKYLVHPTLNNLFKQRLLEKPSTPFSGKVEEMYTSWSACLKYEIEDVVLTPWEQLQVMINHTAGAPKAMIEDYIKADENEMDENSVSLVWAKLDELYDTQEK